jgi:hypothetical protein
MATGPHVDAPSYILNEITRLNANKTTLQAEVDSIDALDYSGCTGIQCALTTRKNYLVAKIGRTDGQLASYLAQATACNCFTTEEQAVVDAINTHFDNKFSGQLDSLKLQSTETRAVFFANYALALTDYVKEIVIKSYFNQL